MIAGEKATVFIEGVLLPKKSAIQMDKKELRSPLPYPRDPFAAVSTPPLDNMVGEDVVPPPGDEGPLARGAVGILP
jgi:hypothetical protein